MSIKGKDYLDKLGIKDLQSFDDFIEDLEKRYDHDLFHQIISELLKQFDGLRNNLYRVKNSRLDLSLDFARWSKGLYQELFDQLLLREPNLSGKILELGCDNGLSTCFLALNYPKAHFIGLDINGMAVSRANELKERLGLKNVRFMVGDAMSLRQTFGSNYCDTVLTIKFIHEIIDFKTGLRSPVFNNKGIQLVKNIAQILKNEGNYINFERIISFDALENWITILETCGLYVALEYASMIPVKELEVIGNLPLLIGRKTHRGRVGKDVLKDFWHTNMG